MFDVPAHGARQHHGFDVAADARQIRGDKGYVTGLSTEEIVAIVRQGHGRYGPCTEYVLQTADALDAAGITDRRLRAIARSLRRPL